MPIQTKRVRVTLDQNPNLKVTARTREHLGVSAVGTDEVQARLLGIPGPQGEQGIQGEIGPEGPQGEVGIIWTGNWDAGTEYAYGQAVSYNGTSYVYNNETPTTGLIPDINPTHWAVLAEKGDDGAPGASGNEHAALMNEPTGFPNLVDSLLVIDDAQRSLTIHPSIGGGTFSYWIGGLERVVSNPESIQVPDVESMYYVYYDSDNILKIATDFPIPFAGKATVAMLYWDAENQEFMFFGEERHGLVMDWATHAYLHDTQGASYGGGFDLYWTDGGDGTTEEELKIGIEDGIIYDEDLRHSIRHSNTPSNFFEQYLTPFARLPIWYRAGADGHWRQFDATEYPVRYGNSFPLYNEYTGTEWVLTDVNHKDYFCMWVYATNEVRNPIVVIMGQGTDIDPENALVVNGLNNLKLGELPTPEFKLLYRLTFEANTNYSNSMKSSLVRVDDYRAFKDFYNIPSASVPIPGGSGSGDKHYEHEQTTPASVWTIVHNLNKSPAVVIADDLGKEVEACIEYVDINTIRIEFSEPFTGKAYFN